MMLESFSENVIQIILTSQDLARAEKSKFVELRHLWGGLIQNKKSSAGVILDKLKIQAKNINLPEIIDKSSYYEVALSKSCKKIIQKALEESIKITRWDKYLRSIFILKAIILDNSTYSNSLINDLDKKRFQILEEIKIFEEFAPDLPKNKSSLPPNDIFAERVILGSILLDSQIIHRVLDFLKPDYFYSYIHQDIFRSALLLNSQKRPTDLKEMSNILSQQGLLGKIGGDMYLIELMESVPGILPLEQQIVSLKKNYLERIEDNKNSLNL